MPEQRFEPPVAPATMRSLVGQALWRTPDSPLLEAVELLLASLEAPTDQVLEWKRLLDEADRSQVRSRTNLRVIRSG